MLERGQLDVDTQYVDAAPSLTPGQPRLDTHGFSAGEPLTAVQIESATHDGCDGGVLTPSHVGHDTQPPTAGDLLDRDHLSHDAHFGIVPVVGDQRCTDPHHANVADSLLLVLGDALDDLERTRVATQNRLRSLEQIKGGTGGSREELRMAELYAGIEALEHQATLDLKRAMRAHPLGDYAKRTVGVGEKQLARLLAVIGNPASRQRPSQLWSYCGYAPGKDKLKKGQLATFNPKAKTRCYLIAEACMKQAGGEDRNGKPLPRSPYRDVYDTARMDWAARETTDLHKHNHALRMVAKAFLLDLWREARTQDRSVPHVRNGASLASEVSA